MLIEPTDRRLSQMDSQFEIYANIGFIEEDEQVDDNVEVIMEEGNVLSYESFYMIHIQN